MSLADKPTLIAGKVDDETLLETEIAAGNAPKKLERLANVLELPTLQKLTALAIEHENIEALMILARSRRFAVARPICTRDGLRLISDRASAGSSIPIEMWYLLRGVTAAAKHRPAFKRLAAQSVLRTSSMIYGRGLRGEITHQVPYHPERVEEFDEDATIENILESGTTSRIRYEDIVGIERREKKKVGVLMLDTSGSMHGEKLTNAALATAVLAHHMRYDEFAVIIFNTKAKILKKLDEQANTYSLIDRILEVEAAGYTNIRDALEKGLIELNKSRERHRWGILVTDGSYNRGGDPHPISRKFPTLHVISTPAQPQGRRTARNLARLGKGRCKEVERHSQIPRTLLELLSKF